jgi:Fe-S-cluster-containing dehydrogenase component
VGRGFWDSGKGTGHAGHPGRQRPGRFSELSPIAHTNTCWYLAQARDKGTGIITVDPRYLDTAAVFADRCTQNKKPICVDAFPTRAMDAGLLDELTAKYGGVKEAEGFAYCGWIGPSICFKPKKYRGLSFQASEKENKK